MTHEVGSESNVDTGHCCHESVDLGCAGRVSSPVAVDIDRPAGVASLFQELLSSKFLKVPESKLKYVCFLQFCDCLSLSLKCLNHQVFELVEVRVDAGSSLSFQ